MGTKHLTPDLAVLQAHSTSELTSLWQQTFHGRAPKQRNLIIRELAWDTLKKQRGGFDQRTKRLLQAAIRKCRQSADVASAPTAVSTPRPRPALPTSFASGAESATKWLSSMAVRPSSTEVSRIAA